MKTYVDGHKVHCELSRNGSLWFKHPTKKIQCMRAKREFALGYQTNLGLISRCNSLQKQLFQELGDKGLNMQIEYRDAGFLHHSTNRLVSFTFTFEETEDSWGEQRLQDVLDKILAYETQQ